MDKKEKKVGPFAIKMIPGQAPYTDAELKTLFRLVGAAADDDPGELLEHAQRPKIREICPNCQQWRHESSGDCLNECKKREFAL